jgi:hypothetical protein
MWLETLEKAHISRGIFDQIIVSPTALKGRPHLA